MTTRTGRPTRRAAAPALTGTAAEDWRTSGICRDEDPELFFPVGMSDLAKAQAEMAKDVCRRCPVRETCLAWALETRQDSGVWGGMAEWERRRAHRRESRVRSAVQRILTTQLAEFDAALAAGLSAWQIAQKLATNVQTVKTATAALEKRQEEARLGMEVAA